MHTTKQSIEYRRRDNLASPARRLGGKFVDIIITILLFKGMEQISMFLDLKGDIGQASQVLPACIYFLFCDALPNGQSIGKRLFDIAVISESSGLNCNILESFARNITIPLITIIDLIFMFFGSYKRLGDMLAKTVVIDLYKEYR